MRVAFFVGKMRLAKKLEAKIKSKKAVVGIIGVGYVGNALGKGAADAGFEVIGFTRSAVKADTINSSKKFGYFATSSPEDLRKCDILAICVPTPIHKDKTPDLEPLNFALDLALKNLKKGALVIIESTIAAGTTRNVALPVLQKSGLKEEEEFFLAFSPERVDPGNKTFTITNTPKVVAGLSAVSKTLVTKFYQSFVDQVVPVSSLEAAELSKLLENTFRFINISFINELQTYANNLGIDLWEVIDASSSKPFGFMPHYPGPGIGGHCIAIDPYYLLDDAQKRNINLGMVEQAGKVNDGQPKKIVEKALEVIKKTNGKKDSHQALIVGISYKEDVDDRRESPSLKIWKMLEEENVSVSYYDPYFPNINGKDSTVPSPKTLLENDVIILATPHQAIDYTELISSKIPIIDAKNALKDYSHPHIYRI